MGALKNTLGIDIGSISFSLALLSPGKEIIKTAYSFHNGSIENALTEHLKDFPLADIDSIALTSPGTSLIKNAHVYDTRISYISSAKHFHKTVGSILIVGAEKFGVILFDENGEYLNYRSNSSCAAGTGSFLDQQAKRLNLSGIEDFAEISYNNKGTVPRIASRCAVFAKTDLIHAQQEGYSLEEICDGLSHGLAVNITETLFNNSLPNSPVIFCGGVSRNKAVVKHISETLKMELIVDNNSNLYGAIGAAINLIDERNTGRIEPGPVALKNASDIFSSEKKEKIYYYSPLEIKLSQYPDFAGIEEYEFKSERYPLVPPVEIDLYEKIKSGKEYAVYLGMDIGSTSTKAVLMGKAKNILAGFYTRTSGRPVEAIQVIFESIDDFLSNKNISVRILAAGTTGSGRKFIKEITGADVALDEITAHARAAYELDSGTDTIIEIGGQDSKFTTMRNGMVTFSIMNNVCAAGTGSFIEEQAKKLGCPLSEYSARAESARAPLSSDKCTVFMERDLNFYLSDGYSVNEVLASVLHSVRENYLTKVAKIASIGSRIFFQGATAKNKALVAAFEQRLHKPIMVSRYCHLTGALGVALHLHDQNAVNTGFRGINIYRNPIPVKTEVCELCTNHCKIKLAEVNNTTVAFGFLCGRDYDTKKFINKNTSEFDLLKTRARVFNIKPRKEYKHDITIGLPAGLHMADDMPLWKKFFDVLSVRTISSEDYMDAVNAGKGLRGAEFCSPVTAMHGHVKYLMGKADYVFLPVYLEEKKQGDAKRQYCYYTQYTPSLIASIEGPGSAYRLLNPVLRIAGETLFYTKKQLYKMLNPIPGLGISFLKVSSAYDKALEYSNSCKTKLKEILSREINDKDINVVFLGRPYTILSGAMNSRIPEIFAGLGIRTFFQDMLDVTNKKNSLEPLMQQVHWHYASIILEAAEFIAGSEGLYPVLVTSFKCAPDSFVIGCLKEIFDAYKKPYLILQLDEHASNIGYETRIEAGIRAFRNHYSLSQKKILPDLNSVNLQFMTGLESLHTHNKTLLLPNFDNLSCKLVEAVLRKEGIDARLLEEKEESIKRSLIFNSGQCLPVNVIAEEAIEYIEKHNLDPGNTLLWMLDSSISCNIGMFPYMIKKVMESYGHGMEQVDILVGSITYLDMSIAIAINAYFAYMFGGLLRKTGCKIRPYEKIKGTTDKAISLSMEILYYTFLRDHSKEEALDKVITIFDSIETAQEIRPKVAIIGDIYARDNEIFNQNLIRTIEDNGGEVISTPYNEYMKIIADPYIQKWFREGLYAEAATTKILKSVIPLLEKKYYKYFNKILKESGHDYAPPPEEILAKFNVTPFHTGESMDTLLKIFTLLDKYPDISLFVQTGPSLCCPSLVTEAMASEIERITGVPVVTLEYDGTGGFKNDDVIPYLKYPRKISVQFEKNLSPAAV
ncbi:MAG: CoA activase [Spirochaetes bacterium]|nr:CoA activase [Spirochaetota bacterium]